MKHAGLDALHALEDVLSAVRVYPALTERKRGTFYRKSIAFLHLHEDPAGLFADVKVGKEFEQFAVNSPEERRALLACIDGLLAVAGVPGQAV